jgi:hypothetical protein
VELNEQDTKPKKVKEPFVPWESAERVRPPWVLQKHGQKVAPPNEQASNNDIATKNVLQPRVEDIATSSHATPLTTNDSGHDQSDEPSGRNHVGAL